MAVLIIAEGTYVKGLSWEAAGQTDPIPALQILKVYKKVLTGLSHVYLAGVFIFYFFKILFKFYIVNI